MILLLPKSILTQYYVTCALFLFKVNFLYYALHALHLLLHL